MVGEGEDEDAVTISSLSPASAEPSQAETPDVPPPQVQHMLFSVSCVKDAT